MDYQRYGIEDFLTDEKFIEWALDPEEKNNLFWKKWLEENPHKKDEVLEAKAILSKLRFKNEYIHSYRLSVIFNNINEGIRREEESNAYNDHFINEMPLFSWKRYLGIAAAIMLLIIAGWSLKGLFVKENELALMAQEVPMNENGETKLFLSQDNIVELINKDSDINYSHNGIVQIDEEAILDVSSTQFNVLVVPYGKRSILVLNDGTKVWVNSGSKLVYPVAFTEKDRRVYLEGEAFFDVAHNTQKPFFVETTNLEVKVLGTSFNVNAYSANDKDFAVLVNGSIELTASGKTIFNKLRKKLEPDHLAVYDLSTKDIAIDNVNVEEYVSWKEGYIILRKTPLNELLTKLTRIYNIQLILSPSIRKDESFTGKLDLKQDIEEIIDIICSTTSLTYTKTERGIILQNN